MLKLVRLSEEKDRRAVEGATGVSERLALAGVLFRDKDSSATRVGEHRL